MSKYELLRTPELKKKLPDKFKIEFERALSKAIGEWQKKGYLVDQFEDNRMEASFEKDFLLVASHLDNNLWKPADGDDLPEIDREVIALVGLEGFFEIPPDKPIKLSYKVVFAHRPPEYWDGKNILTGKVTRNYTMRYDKGGWSVPNVKYWLDLDLPKMEE